MITNVFAATVRRRPMLSFVVLAFGLSWLLWAPYVLSVDGLGVLPLRFPSLLGDSELAGLLPGAYFGPLFAAFLVTMLADGRAGLRVWAARLVRWRIGWRWYAFGLLGIPALLVLGSLPLPGALTHIQAPPAEVWLLYPPMLLVQILTTGLAEEPGWRDFALPRMQTWAGPLAGTMILAAVWISWHLPLFLTGWAAGIGGASLLGFTMFSVVGVCQSVIITWVFNRTNESLPGAILIHANNNNFLALAWPAIFPALGTSSVLTASILGYGALTIILLIATRCRLGYQHDATQETTPRSTTRLFECGP
jgi:membrane protease YdiL (CAAX protease family)